ncbi:MAG: flippase-like domain-containing protein [Actinomycetota bacterium]|nr:flippase-like domain-containing protein [Actinomycetota bacterium]
MDDVRAFLDAFEAFFRHLAAVSLGTLALALAFHVLRLTLRVRAWQNILRASYPEARAPFRRVFGAYVAGIGVNAITPARAGDLVKLYLAKRRVDGSSYPTLGSTLVVETLFDFVVGLALFLWALERGLLPALPRLPGLGAFDWSFFAEHPRLAAMLASVLVGGAILLLAWASTRVADFRANVRRGFTILGDRRTFATKVVSWQAGSWAARAASVAFFLEAFHIQATVETVLAVLVVQGLATMLPFTPGGAGTQQAVLVFALAGTAQATAVLSFSVGMQLATVAVNVALGFGAIAVMMRTLRWRSRVLAPEEGLARGKPGAARSRSALRG